MRWLDLLLKLVVKVLAFLTGRPNTVPALTSPSDTTPQVEQPTIDPVVMIETADAAQAATSDEAVASAERDADQAQAAAAERSTVTASATGAELAELGNKVYESGEQRRYKASTTK